MEDLHTKDTEIFVNRNEMVAHFMEFIEAGTLDSAIAFISTVTDSTKEEITESFCLFGIDSDMDFINYGEKG